MVIFDVGGVCATTRAIGPRESTRKARAKPLANTVPSFVASVFARARSCARSNVERTGGPRTPHVCYAGVLRCFRRCYDAARRRERCELFFFNLMTLRLGSNLIGFFSTRCARASGAVPPRGMGTRVRIDTCGLGLVRAGFIRVRTLMARRRLAPNTPS